MSCKCVTLRSLVYFGASIHVVRFIGTILLLIFGFQVSLYFYRVASHTEAQLTMTWISFITILVGALFFPTGCAIFKGVEKESLLLIQWGSVSFFFLKVIDLTFKIYLDADLRRKRIEKKGFFSDLEIRLYQAIDVFGCVAYLLVLLIYGIQLKQSYSTYIQSGMSQKNVPSSSTQDPLLKKNDPPFTSA